MIFCAKYTKNGTLKITWYFAYMYKQLTQESGSYKKHEYQPNTYKLHSRQETVQYQTISLLLEAMELRPCTI